MPSPRRQNDDVLRFGDRSAAVTEIRAALAALGLLDNPDDDVTTGRHVALDVFDAQLDEAVRAFQQHRGLLVDGIVGEATYRALKEASYRLGARTLYHQFGAPLYGDDVATLQARLQDLGFYTGLVDGHFGLQTHTALMSYQREYGLAADGICGPETLRSLYFLSSRVTGGSPHAIREEELVRRSGPKLSGKRIIIDPGLGGADHGLISRGPAGPISEADVLWDLASRLEGRMTAIGMETFLSRPTNRSPSDAERAATANNVGADLMISLRCESQYSPVGQRRCLLPLRQLAWFGLHHRSQSRRLHSARSGGPHRFTGLPHAWPDVGSVAADSDADRSGRRRLHHQSARPRDAGLHPDPRCHRRRHPRRGQAPLLAGKER